MTLGPQHTASRGDVHLSHWNRPVDLAGALHLQQNLYPISSADASPASDIQVSRANSGATDFSCLTGRRQENLIWFVARNTLYATLLTTAQAPNRDLV